MRARSCVFWTNINQQLTDLVKNCEVCIANQNKQCKEPLMSTSIPTYPIQLLGSDLMHWNNQDFLIMVDYYSRYFEIERLHSTRSETIIKKMKKIFSRMGIPEELRSDNGPQYASEEFRDFTRKWEIQHITSSPSYPKANGLAERQVQTVKNILQKAKDSNQDPYLALLEARNTPVDNFASPAQLVSGRQYRSIIPVNPKNLMINPFRRDNFEEHRCKAQNNQARYYNTHTKELEKLERGERVRILKDNRWRPAVVIKECQEPRSYEVEMENGRSYRRNRSHLMKTSKGNHEDKITIPDDDDDDNSGLSPITESKGRANGDQVDDEEQNLKNDNTSDRTTVNILDNEFRTRSGRVSRMPKRCNEYELEK